MENRATGSYLIKNFTNNTEIKLEDDPVGQYFHPWQYGPNSYFQEKWLNGGVIEDRHFTFPKPTDMGFTLSYTMKYCRVSVILFDEGGCCYVSMSHSR
jgi:hypothetical protein